MEQGLQEFVERAVDDQAHQPAVTEHTHSENIKHDGKRHVM